MLRRATSRCVARRRRGPHHPSPTTYQSRYVALLANFALATAENVSIALGLSRVCAGATLLAVGAQIPDVMGSMAMSRQGMSDGAIANAAGSQVANVALGVGLPFMFFSLSSGSE